MVDPYLVCGSRIINCILAVYLSGLRFHHKMFIIIVDNLKYLYFIY